MKVTHLAGSVLSRTMKQGMMEARHVDEMCDYWSLLLGYMKSVALRAGRLDQGMM